MSNRLVGKTALITGAGSGIGRQVATRFAAEGARVVFSDRNFTAVADAAGGKDNTLAIEMDISREESVQAGFARARAEGFEPDVVVANAAVQLFGQDAQIADLDLDAWNRTIAINLTGTFLTVKHSIPHLRAAGGGSIIITASVNGNTLFSLPGYSAYSTSKAGAVAFTKMAALELARWEIRVNAILPGAIQTNIGERTYRRNLDRVDYGFKPPAKWPPLRGESAQPSEVADLVLFLASDASRYMTGAELLIDAAYTLWRG
jgi:NAD(P)-dependent dehydrogenase (short-subunit alcohol dehydrogenase family)